MKLGKAPAKYDPRNLKLADLFKAVLPPIPDAYIFDDDEKVKIPTPTFSNLTYGDCVIAGRAHQTYRLQYREHKKVVKITEKAVVKQYFKESGGYDEGLVMLDSLKSWRRDGWKLKSCWLDFMSRSHKIHAFAQVAGNSAHIKAAIYLLGGIQLGLSLPLSAQRQIDNGRPWAVVTEQDSEPNSWGGHCVYACGFIDRLGVLGITWGKKQWMSWEFITKYCDEAYAVVDEVDRWPLETRAGIDVEKLESFLNSIK